MNLSDTYLSSDEQAKLLSEPLKPGELQPVSLPPTSGFSGWYLCLFFLVGLAVGALAHSQYRAFHPPPLSTPAVTQGVYEEMWFNAAMEIAKQEEARLKRPLGPAQFAVYKKLVEDMYPGEATVDELRGVMSRAMDIARASRVFAGAPPPDTIRVGR